MTSGHLPFISALSAHYVGNQQLDEPLTLTTSALDLTDELQEKLAEWLSLPMKSDAYFHLHHESDIALNEVFAFVKNIFDQPETLHEQSQHLAKHLYACSTHPNIKSGEFYVAYLQDCIVEGCTVEAVALFKSETKDPFLKVHQEGKNFKLESHQGIPLQKLDKGCLIYAIEQDDGFVVSVIDNTNKGEEARYWKDEFLGLKPRSDKYHHTSAMLSMCQDFIKKELPQKFEVSKADQADMLNRSARFFKEQDRFSMNEFTHTVMGAPAVIDDFSRYKEEYEQERGMPIDDGFEISTSAVKARSRGFKSVLKLDRNFHVYIHGNREMIERGEDQFGRKFYKLYFEEEN